MNNTLKTLSLVSVLALLSACASTDEAVLDDSQYGNAPALPALPGEGGAQVGTRNAGAIDGQENMPGAEGVRNEMGVLVDEFGIPTDTVFYFDYDRASINADDLNTLASHGQYIAASPNARVRLEGHTDERGTREYNIALGENRAKAVARILMLQGVRPDQIAVVSMGEEEPAEDGHDEVSWSLNRRVQIVYEAR
ncbi:peptidoglycan-associated lipoprotein Pal [Granulosicoccaceae sp. 1_MG-2023]|nr:peptidoglycan-associated lipoprotein Pal [Granulosicoccaceae sp. 1_MG-2023]